ncbi:MAG: hypothetical protein IJ863_08200, partial [Spirochaetales bacterium]|nr:hypothetical protein [Spirochaetales bacterium]
AMDEVETVVSCEGSLIKVRPSITNCDTAELKFTTAHGASLYYYASHAVDDTKIGPMSEYEFENGVVTEAAGGFIGRLSDGRELDYTGIDKGERLEKLWECVRCVQEGRTPVCTLKTAREHTHAVLMAQGKGVVDMSAKAIAKVDQTGSIYYTLESLSRNLVDSYAQWRIGNSNSNGD